MNAPTRTSHDIEYTISGHDLQCVEIILDPGESVVAEAGAMMYQDGEIGMRAIMGDGSEATAGLFGKMKGMVSRKLSGENIFMTHYTNNGSGKRKVAFAAPYAGSILPVDLRQMGGQIAAQRGAFLCAAQGTTLGIAFQKRLSAGLFGGEGFVLQRISGDGLAFIHTGGVIVERRLEAGEVLKVDTGCLAAMQGNLKFEIESITNIKSLMFGGEGMFLAKLTGPGRVWVQSLPYQRTLALIREEVLSGIKRVRGSK